MNAPLARAAVARILRRLARAWGATVTDDPSAALRWRVAFEPDSSAEPAAEATLDVGRDASGAVEIRCDAPSMMGEAQAATLLARFLAALSSRLANEAITWDEPAALLDYLVERSHAERGDGFVVVTRADAEHVPLIVSTVRVASEPWLNVAVVLGGRSEVDAIDALRKNAEMAFASLALVEDLDRYDLGYSMPLAGLSAARLEEIFDDLLMLREGLVHDLVGEGIDDDGSDDDADLGEAEGDTADETDETDEDEGALGLRNDDAADEEDDLDGGLERDEDEGEDEPEADEGDADEGDADESHDEPDADDDDADESHDEPDADDDDEDDDD